MILNLLHRPGEGPFELQQEIAHSLNLKVTLMLRAKDLFDQTTLNTAIKHHQQYGDEIGLWFMAFDCPEFDRIIGGQEEFIWLRSKEDKQRIFDFLMGRFYELFGRYPTAVGAYHMDCESLNLLKAAYPGVKITVAGCFEEGVKVFHGCNNSWYLFNEGMPWQPWYPSKNHSLRPAESVEDAIDIVAVPHLSRDLVLSYEGRNDFWASHSGNVQRGLGNEGTLCPYNFNLVDQYRLQEKYNDGYSYYHVFCSAGWLEGNPNIQDPDEVSQALYREKLEYFARLRNEGNLIDMHMSEYADWHRKNIPVCKPAITISKEILYGSRKHYHWYIDPYFRVLIDCNQGGSIGDLRPYAGKVAVSTGPDSPHLVYGSYPYIIHSQYRTGNSTHAYSGSRTTLLLNNGEETIDLCTCRTRNESICDNGKGKEVNLTAAMVKFKNGDTVTVSTSFVFAGNGSIIIKRRYSELKGRISVCELFKGCAGITEYPVDLHGVKLYFSKNPDEQINYAYRSRQLCQENPAELVAEIPQVNTIVRWSGYNTIWQEGEVSEGFLFNPYFSLELKKQITANEESAVCLKIEKI